MLWSDISHISLQKLYLLCKWVWNWDLSVLFEMIIFWQSPCLSFHVLSNGLLSPPQPGGAAKSAGSRARQIYGCDKNIFAPVSSTPGWDTADAERFQCQIHQVLQVSLCFISEWRWKWLEHLEVLVWYPYSADNLHQAAWHHLIMQWKALPSKKAGSEICACICIYEHLLTIDALKK